MFKNENGSCFGLADVIIRGKQKNLACASGQYLVDI